MVDAENVRVCENFLNFNEKCRKLPRKYKNMTYLNYTTLYIQILKEIVNNQEIIYEKKIKKSLVYF